MPNKVLFELTEGGNTLRLTERSIAGRKMPGMSELHITTEEGNDEVVFRLSVDQHQELLEAVEDAIPRKTRSEEDE